MTATAPMRTIALRYFVIVSAALAGGSALLLCPRASASETPLSDPRALTSAHDCSRDAQSSSDDHWTIRLVDDDNSADSTDDDGDDAPDGIVAAAPRQIDVDGNAYALPSRPLQVVNRADLDSYALRGPPRGAPSDSSHSKDDDDEAPGAVIVGSPIRPIDLQTIFFVHDHAASTYAVNAHAHSQRGAPPAVESVSPNLTNDRTPPHAFDDGSFEIASGGTALRAPPN